MIAATGKLLSKTTPDVTRVPAVTNGTEGDLQATGDSGHLQIFRLCIKNARGDLALRPPASSESRLPRMARSLEHP